MVDFVSVNRGIITEVIYPEGNYMCSGDFTNNVLLDISSISKL